MPFDNQKYHKPATRGDVGYSVYMVQHALEKLSMMVEKVANAANVEISEDMSAIRHDIDLLRKEFDDMTGWQPE